MNQEQFNQLARSFQPARIILTAVELDLFPPLVESPQSAEEIAALRRTNVRATERLLDALTGLEILIKEDRRYRISESLIPSLDPNSPGYQGDMFRHMLRLWDSWSQLTEVVRSGTPPERESKRGEDFDRRAFICGMANIARRSATELANAVDFSEDRRLLDVGGGPGTYALTLAESYPELSATVLDFAEVLEITKEQIGQYGLADRVDTHAGNALEDAYGEGYDTVLMSNLIHAFGAEEIRGAFRRAYDALRAGGRLLVKDFLVDSTRTQPSSASIFGINMLVNTPRGDVYTREELEQWLTEAGFESVSELSLATFSTVLIAKKA